MSMFGGGEVRLGPYDFLIQSEATDATDAATANFWTIPANVTLIGVPNKTIIYKKAVFGESVGNTSVNLKSLGPVVSLGGDGASIVGCTVYLDLLTGIQDLGGARGADFRSDGSTGIAIHMPDTGFSDVVVADRKNTCIIYAGGDYTRRKVQGCTVGSVSIDAGDQDLIGVYIDDTGHTKTMVANNFFMNLCGTIYTAGVYLLDDAKSAGIVGNIAEHDAAIFVSVLAGDATHNAITGNVGLTVNR